MIYKKENIDMSVVTSPYEEQSGYIAIEDEYTNNVLKLSGYLDITGGDFIDLCDKRVFVNKLTSYALKSPEYSYLYARDILKGGFELGESIIATDAEYSYMYAADLMPNRFELGEPIISTDTNYKKLYERHFSIAIATDTDTMWKELL